MGTGSQCSPAARCPPTSTTGQSNEAHPAGEKRYSGVSGTQGDILVELELFLPSMRVQGAFATAWLTAVEWAETLDRPCGVRIKGLRPIEYAGGRVHENWDDEKFLMGCEGAGLLGQELVFADLNQGSPSPLNGGDASAISRIQVCHNDRDNRRMKGLRIYGSRIGTDGSIIQENNADATELPNCRRWAPAVICPADTMGTGLVIHATEASGTNQQIVGLQLICREISTTL